MMTHTRQFTVARGRSNSLPMMRQVQPRKPPITQKSLQHYQALWPQQFIQRPLAIDHHLLKTYNNPKMPAALPGAVLPATAEHRYAGFTQAPLKNAAWRRPRAISVAAAARHGDRGRELSPNNSNNNTTHMSRRDVIAAGGMLLCLETPPAHGHSSRPVHHMLDDYFTLPSGVRFLDVRCAIQRPLALPHSARWRGLHHLLACEALNSAATSKVVGGRSSCSCLQPPVCVAHGMGGCATHRCVTP